MNRKSYEKTLELQERLLSLAADMAASDAHAAKCTKLGLEFKKEYPDEYRHYTQARNEYNAVEEELAALKAAPDEDTIPEERILQENR